MCCRFPLWQVSVWGLGFSFVVSYEICVLNSLAAELLISFIMVAIQVLCFGFWDSGFSDIIFRIVPEFSFMLKN